MSFWHFKGFKGPSDSSQNTGVDGPAERARPVRSMRQDHPEGVARPAGSLDYRGGREGGRQTHGKTASWGRRTSYMIVQVIAVTLK